MQNITTQIIKLLQSITNAISNYFNFKTISFNDDTIEYIDNQIEKIKDEIITELNKHNPNMHYINRLYKQLSNLYSRKTKL